MNITQPIDVGNADTGRIGTPTIPLHPLVHLVSIRRILLLEFQVEIRVVGMMINGQDFPGLPVDLESMGPFTDNIQRPADLRMAQFISGVAATRIDQVIKTGALDVFRLDEIKDIVQIHAVAPGQCQAQTHFLTSVMTVANSADGRIEGTLLAPKDVVGFANAVQRDPDIGDVELLDLPRALLVDQGPVGRDRHA